MITFESLHPDCTPEHLGYLPTFFSEHDPRPAAVQLDENYKHGGGWNPLPGWKMNPVTRRIQYPGDPSLTPIATTMLHDERLLFYDYAIFCIVQPDGSFECGRVD